MFIFLLIAAAFAFYIMNTEERNHVMRWIVAANVVLRRLAALLLAGLLAWGRAIHARNRLAQGAAIALLFVASLGAIVLTRPAPTDIRPEIERLLAVESQTTAIYDAAAAQFRLGALDSESLARVIERKIKPELQSVRVRVMSLDNVRSDQEALLEKAREYLRLRDDSWRLRAQALHRRDLKSLQKVELTERASLAALTAAAEGMKEL
jgi:hypothetical protein